MSRVPITVGLATVLAILIADGRFETLIEALEAVDIEALENIDRQSFEDAESVSELRATLESEVFSSELEQGLLPPELESAILDLFSAEIIAIGGGAVVLSFVVGIVVKGLSNAAAINGIYGCLYDSDGVLDAVEGVGRDWKSFVGISFAQTGVFVIGILPIAVGVSLFTVSPVAGIVGTLIGLLLAAGIVTIGLLAFAFAGQSVVVDGVGARTAIGRSAKFPFRQPKTFVAYVLVVLGVFGGLSVVGGGLGALGVSQLSGLLSSLVAIPFLDAFKTMLYADRPAHTLVSTDEGRQSADAEPADDWQSKSDGGGHSRRPDSRPTSIDYHSRPIDSQSLSTEPQSRLVDGRSESTDGHSASTEAHPTPTDDQPATHHRLIAAFRDGVGALGGFTRGHPGSILLAAMLFSAAAIAGWRVTAAFGLDLPMGDNVGDVFGTVPIDIFVTLAANNWLVSATAAYSGVALGVPTAVDMVSNGFVVGALAGVAEPVAFVALVAPHGVIELPAIVIAGGLGFHLAATTAGVVRGTRTSTELAEALRLTYRVLLGLAVVLIVAAFIEAFLTPLIAELILT